MLVSPPTNNKVTAVTMKVMGPLVYPHVPACPRTLAEQSTTKCKNVEAATYPSPSNRTGVLHQSIVTTTSIAMSEKYP